MNQRWTGCTYFFDHGANGTVDYHTPSVEIADPARKTRVRKPRSKRKAKVSPPPGLEQQSLVRRRPTKRNLSRNVCESDGVPSKILQCLDPEEPEQASHPPSSLEHPYIHPSQIEELEEAQLRLRRQIARTPKLIESFHDELLKLDALARSLPVPTSFCRSHHGLVAADANASTGRDGTRGGAEPCHWAFFCAW